MTIQQPEQWIATGRRKEAVARIYLRPGTGVMKINRRSVEDYFPRGATRMMMLEPYEITGCGEKFDALVNVRGGGLTGQAGAIRHALARALLEHDPEHRAALKRAGMLTRDARRVERKKYGQPGARKRFQFSKR